MIGLLRFVDMFTAAMLFLLPDSEICASLEKSPLAGWPTCISILWKWASMLTELARDGEFRLSQFHAIRNFLANDAAWKRCRERYHIIIEALDDIISTTNNPELVT